MITRRAHRGSVLGAVVLAVSVAVSGTAAHAATRGQDADANVVVTVPTLGFQTRDDRFLVGLYRSRLHVLSNDPGTPDPDLLRLVDDGGLARPVVNLRDLGQLRVADGYVVFRPRRGAEGRAFFSYLASSPNGPLQGARAEVVVFPRVIVVADDAATTSLGSPVSLDVVANDRLVVPGAALACRPQLFGRRPPRADPLPVVLPEPGPQPVVCAPEPTVTTRDGQWRVGQSGQVVFTPATGFTGTATAYYRQASSHPYDLGTARISVSGPSPGAVLGVRAGRGPEGRDRSGGPLASSGATALSLLLLAGSALAGTGVALRIAARHRRRQAPARDA